MHITFIIVNVCEALHKLSGTYKYRKYINKYSCAGDGFVIGSLFLAHSWFKPAVDGSNLAWFSRSQLRFEHALAG